MKMCFAFGVPLAIVLLSGCTLAAGDLKSGPQVGDSIPAFDPMNVNGPFAGKNRCLVWFNGSKPVVMIFAREIDDPLTSLVKKVNEANAKKGKKMASFVVVLKEGVEEQLKKLGEKEGIKDTVLTYDKPAGPEGLKIDKEAAVTVVLYVNKKAKVNHTFKKGELQDKQIEAILGDLPKIVKEEE